MVRKLRRDSLALPRIDNAPTELSAWLILAAFLLALYSFSLV